MSVTHLPGWDITAIEIALDLELLQFAGMTTASFSKLAEPRICLITCFALTSQLRHIVTSVDRVVPSRLPALRTVPGLARDVLVPRAAAITPMLPLLRLQQRLIRAIQPGLGDQRAAMASGRTDLDAASARFIGDFLANESLPAFEPAAATADLSPMRMRANGITIYRLGKRGAPKSILGHWAYARDARGSVHLRSGP